jgi:hypothetical protein
MSKTKQPKEPEFNGEAKQAIALAFQGIGGLKALTAWARTHRAAFYQTIYTKLLPLQVSSHARVDVKVQHDGEQARQKLHDAFMRILEERRDDAGRSPIGQVTYTRIDNDAAGDAPPSAGDGGPSTGGARPATMGDDPASRADDLISNSNHPQHEGSPLCGGPSADRKTYAQPVSAAPREPTTTELFFEYNNNRRPWFGPIGDGGPP